MEFGLDFCYDWSQKLYYTKVDGKKSVRKNCKYQRIYKISGYRSDDYERPYLRCHRTDW